MALQDRINKIKPFFVNFNIDAKDGVSVLLVRFPQGWQIPEGLTQHFGVETAARQEGIYFVAEIEKGTDVLFDAVDYSAEFNQSIIEKSELLKEKINELKEIFIGTPIEKLRTLEFVFPPQKKGGKKQSVKQAPVVETKTEAVEEIAEPVEEVNNDDSVEGDADNDLMSMAKGIVGE